MLESSPPASGVRYRVLALLCMLAMITYMDRAANGNAKAEIARDLGVSIDDYFYVIMAFQLAYALFEIPSGWLGDTRGPRSTLLRIVVWWAAFVALTGFAGLTIPLFGYVGFTGLIVIQFLFGIGEAGAFPNISKALYNWFPATERAGAKSAVWMSARWMGGLTPLLWTLLTDGAGLSWREGLWLFAGIAVFWCAAFALTFRNHPGSHPGVNAAEQALIDRGRVQSRARVIVPWGKLLRSRNLLALCLMYVVTNFCWYFLMYDLPNKMKSQFPDWNNSLNGKMLLALLAGAPLFVGSFGCRLGGILSDRYIRRTGDVKWGRRLYGMIGYGGAGLCYIAAAFAHYYEPNNLWLFAGLLILMGFLNDLMMAPAWAVCQDIGRNYSATVAGSMNMFGNLIGAVGGIFITGILIKLPQGIIYCFALYSFVYFLGVIAWMFIDASQPIENEPI